MRYEDIGVQTLINAWDNITTLGGSRMDPEVIQAMAEASGCFVDLNDLLQKAGARIAALTRNEAACITCGAAAGLMLAASACMTGHDPDRIARLPDTAGMANEIMIHKSQRISWDRCVRQSGARLVEIGGDRPVSPADLEQAYTDQTVAILYYASSWYEIDALPLEQVIASARRHQVPVIVDAAANLPPVENLWHYTHLGADLVIFSGGKGLGGPQNTGLILGKENLVEACRLQASPYSAIGRVAKVGKEEIMGLLTAVERFVASDHAAVLAVRERWVASLIAQLDPVPEIEVSRVYPGPHGQSYPRVQVRFQEAERRDEMVQALKSGDPSIIVGYYPFDDRSIYINPLTLQASEVQLIADQLIRLCQVKTNQIR